MATGPIVGVELRAETSRFQAEMQKASQSVEGVVGRMKSSFGSLQGMLAGLGVGLSIGGLAVMARNVASMAEALGDMADVTGSSVEDLSKLSNQAKVAGGNFEEFEGALLKFTKNLGAAEDETSAFSIALRNLGVTSKDPATALQQTIAGFDKFANGATKAAYAQEIFGKAGPRFLATLSDMAKLQDVGATMTAKQVEETERLSIGLRSLTVQATGFSNAVLSEIVPALNQMLQAFIAARQEGAGFFQALALGFDASSPNFDVMARLTKAYKDLGEEKEKLARNNSGWFDFLPATDESVRRAQQVVNSLEAVRIARLGGPPTNAQFGARPPLAPLPTVGGGAEKISEAQRYLDNLQQQLDKTQELGTVEKVLLDIQRGRLKLSGTVTKEQIIHVAQLIDAQKELDKELESSKKLREEEAKAREKTSVIALQSLQAVIHERDNLAEQNQQIREETELLGKDVISIRAIYQARLDNLIATKEQALAARLNVTGMDAEASAMQDQINVLKERKGLLGDRGFAEDMALAAQRAKELGDIFTNNLADGLTDVVTGTKSVSDAFKSMERNIVASLSRIASQKIAESIFGSPTSSGGGGIFGGLGGMLEKWFGRGFTSGAGASDSMAFLGFAGGGFPPVGRPSLVGERGPELFVPRTSGVIIPNDVLMARRAAQQPININIAVDGSTTRSTADQIAVRTGTAVRRALARNT